jgi:hypothetical protein
MQITHVPFVASIFALLVLIPPDVSAPEAEYPRRSGVVEIPPPSIRSWEWTGETGTVELGTDETGVGPNINVTRNISPQVETSVAADPVDPENLVGGIVDYRYGDSDAGYSYSFDAGATWFANTLVAANPALGKYDAQGDPAVRRKDHGRRGHLADARGRHRPFGPRFARLRGQGVHRRGQHRGGP